MPNSPKVATRPGVKHLPKGATGYNRISNSWNRAVQSGLLTTGAAALAMILVIQPETFDTSVRNLARISQMSRGTIQTAMNNLVQLGLADPVMKGNICIGYAVDFSREAPGVDQKLGHGVAQNLDQGGLKIEPHIKTPLQDSSSLRSSELRLASAKASAKPVATISVDRSGQVGFGFSDDQGVIPDAEIARIMTELRKLDIKGDPEDYELREFVTARIAFMTSPEFKGKKLQRGGKETTQDNRNRVIGFSMRIITKDGFKWGSKRVDPVHAERAQRIRAEIAELERRSQIYRMVDGSEITVREHDELMLKVQTHRDELIRKRLALRPESINRDVWRRRVEDLYTIEAATRHLFGDRADHYLVSDEDRTAYRRQANVLREELMRML